MKKYILVLSAFLCIFACLGFAACKKQAVTSADNLDSAVAYEIASIDGSNEFDHDTLRALTFIVKSNIINSNSSNIDESVLRTSTIDEKLYNKVLDISATYTDILANKTYKITNNEPEKRWSKEIKKTDILKYLNKKHLSLSSISNIKEYRDKDNSITYLDIGGKKLDFGTVMKDFDLPSGKVDIIKNKKSSLIVEGERDTEDIICIKNAKDWAKNNKIF